MTRWEVLRAFLSRSSSLWRWASLACTCRSLKPTLASINSMTSGLKPPNTWLNVGSLCRSTTCLSFVPLQSSSSSFSSFQCATSSLSRLRRVIASRFCSTQRFNSFHEVSKISWAISTVASDSAPIVGASLTSRLTLISRVSTFCSN